MQVFNDIALLCRTIPDLPDVAEVHDVAHFSKQCREHVAIRSLG